MNKAFFRSFAILIAFQLFASTHLFAQEIPIGAEYIKSNKLIEEGIELHNEKKYTEAIEKYSQVYPGDSLYRLAQYEICLSYYFMDSFDKSIKIADELIADKSYRHKLDAILVKINSLSEAKRYEEVHEVCNDALKMFPLYNVLYIKRGLNYERMEKFDLAYKEYQESLRLNPLFSTTHYQLGKLYAKMNLPSLSILAYQTFLLTSDNANFMNTALNEMENVCRNQAEIDLTHNEAFRKNLGVFEESDLVVKSQAAFGKKYKSAIKLNYLSSRQLQLVCERLSKEAITNDEVANFYVNLYTTIWEKKFFESCVLVSFRQLDAKDVVAEIKKKQKKTDVFIEWATTYLGAMRENKSITVDGKTGAFTFEYDGSFVDGYGKKDANNKKTGEWKYFYTNGAVSAIGNFTDDNITGRWKYFYDNGNLKRETDYNSKGEISGDYISYFENGEINEHLRYKDGKLDGISRIYRANASLKVEIGFKDDNPDDLRKYYNDHSGLDEEQPYSEGKVNGVVKSYHKEGTLASEITYVKSEMDGPAKYYHSNGKTSYEGKYVAGKLEGSYKEYDENGTLRSESNFSKGKLNGIKKYLNENGTIIITESYKDGEFEGFTYLFDSRGRKLGDFNYKKSDLVAYKYYDTLGKVIHQQTASNKSIYITRYNEFRQKIAEGKFTKEGNEGEWKYYYANGVLESIVNYKDGDKNGISTSFYYNGRKMNEKSYTNDEINGYYRSWHQNGEKEAEGYLVDGEQEGQWKFYHDNGVLESISFFNAGKKNGPNVSFELDGKITQTMHYFDGIITGITQYDTVGKVINDAKIKNGNGHLYWKHSNGVYSRKNKYKFNYLDSTITVSDYKNIVNSIENYKFGELSGLATYYYTLPLNKTKSSEGTYKNNKRDGEWKTYYFNGKLMKVENYKKGELEGKSEIYNEAGFIERVMTYKEDERINEMFVYSSTNELALKLFYVNGVLTQYTYLNENKQFVPYIKIENETGHIKAYYPNKQVSADYHVKNGFIDGDYLIYFSNGKLMNKEHYVNNLKHGPEFNYAQNGNLLSEYTWVNGNRHGDFKFYHLNGKLHIKANYTHDYVHGLVVVYDENGKEVKREKYYYGLSYE
jgi:antitoxin component YwqK of YwqJK toxin-antitoxin module